jgi:hypothetical protein
VAVAALGMAVLVVLADTEPAQEHRAATQAQNLL